MYATNYPEQTFITFYIYMKVKRRDYVIKML